MKRFIVVVSLLWSMLPALVDAAGFTNQFNSGFDFVTQGIIGNTNWDGVYLRFGDVLNGDAGGDGAGATIQANETNSPGSLTVQTHSTTWSGAADDGFFAYKLVAGDFDVSVKTEPPWDPKEFASGGLLVRAWNTNNSGAPASFTGSPSENWLGLWRFQQFGINLIQQSSNNIFFQATFPESDSDTNSSRYFRITRSGDVFAFYWKTNEPDAWTLITNATPSGGYAPATGTLARPDWHDRAVQVGISEATFSANSTVGRFAEFQLSGPNVTFPAMPPAPSNLVVVATNLAGALTFSWTPGDPEDGSLVVMRALGNIQHSPVNGLTYASNSTFGITNACLGGGNEFVVYNGHGNSVTVSNLGNYYTWYTVAVYEYSGSGSSTIYNTANPATIVPLGPIPVTSVAVQLNSTNIPVGGAALATLLVTYGAGPPVPLTADPSVLWSSSDPSVATVGADGTVTGVGIGTASITGALSGFTASADVTVHWPVLTDDFAGTNDFLGSGLIGSHWDGLYLKFGDVPGGNAGVDGAGATTALNSRIDSTNGLSLSSLQSDWQSAADDGPFLFKLAPGSINAVSGDFEAAAHVLSEGIQNAEAVGLMARLFEPNGGPGPSGHENHVNYWKVQNGPTSVRQTQNGANTTVIALGSNLTNTWLLLQRIDSTNFFFFEKGAGSGSWVYRTNTILSTASNHAPMQVGLAQQTLSTNTGSAVVDHFMLDASGILTSLTPPPPAAGVSAIFSDDRLSLIISYTVGTNADGTAIGSVVVMRAGGPITTQPYTGMDLPGNLAFGDPANDLGGGNYLVYRSPPGSLQTNVSVTVSNLAPATLYYVAVYTFVGAGATRTFNETGGASGYPTPPPPLYDIAVTVPPVPLNGIGLIQLLGKPLRGLPYPLVIGPTNPAVTSGDTNVVKVLDGIVTGVGLGTTTVQVVYTTSTRSLTNVSEVTVRPATFNDDFGVSHDYLQGGVTGTLFDGIYDVSGAYPIPGSTYVPPAGSGTLVADANITSNHVLTITGTGDGWENALSGGFFLYKHVPGDFQMAVHIPDFTRTNYNQPGLMARAYASTNGVLGQPLGYEVPGFNGTNNASEYWVSLVRFDEFGIGTYARLNTDGPVVQSIEPDQGDTNNWLLIVRSFGTNFSFYKKMNQSDPWRNLPLKTVYHVPQFAGRPMEVGLMAGDWNLAPAPPNSVAFDGFMLDLTTSALALQVSDNHDETITVSWPADPASELQSSPSLDAPDWQPVGGTPALGINGRYSLTVPIEEAAQYFRLRN